MNKFIYLVISIILIGGAFAVLANEISDTTAPMAISDLAVSSTTVSSVTLTWTAPGDDIDTGTTTSYDLRYATTTITESNWASAFQVTDEPTPQIASSSETAMVSSLASSTLYYFAIKSKDEANNESALSNVVSTTTLAEIPPETPQEPTGLTFEMNVTPETLNPASQGQWVTVHLFLPAGYLASQVDISSLKLNDSLSPDTKFKGLNHYQHGQADKGSRSSNLVIKFSRAGVISLIGSSDSTETLTLTGKIDGEDFSATDTINVLNFTPATDDTLIMSTSSPEVYVIKNGRKRHIPSPAAFENLGYQWQNIGKFSQQIVNAYQNDDLLKSTDSPSVYLIITGRKRHLPSAEVFESYGFNWSDISVVPVNELDNYPNADLIRPAGDARVYLLAGGKKHWIPSATLFNSKGYKWENIIIVNSTEATALPDGQDVTQ